MTQGALQQEKSSKKREGGAWGSNSMVSNTGGLSHELHVLFRIDKFVPIFFFFLRNFSQRPLSVATRSSMALISASLFYQTATDGGCVCFQNSGMQLFAAMSRRGRMDLL